MQKYGLTSTDFIRYKDYFFKMLEDVGLQDDSTNKKVKLKIEIKDMINQ